MNSGHKRLSLISGDNGRKLSHTLVNPPFACTVLFNIEMLFISTETENA